ncbi:PREDICTED: transcription elongation factor SPT6-like [Thamnophis sirtalis]|uniref:Transcription elongation factor SPT6-like n=1 Tax=Thamnophis sirtalis TaxID=35019 RepID=A0A6I9YCY6_9SAUR|nr:PREDICTED: transcription elongation factor SPT6-like [Thamnophis sirtalis]
MSKKVKEELLGSLYCEFINRVNEVGVDVNRAIAHPHSQALLQFVCGLGPRKGAHLLKILKQNNTRLENRTQLVTMCHMGPKVFINCAGFIKIDTASLGDRRTPVVGSCDPPPSSSVQVWNHFDSGSCPGQAIGVKTRLDNGVTGFIPTKFLSDKVVKRPEERVKVGMTVHCRIMKIDIEKFSADLTCRTSDLMDRSNEWKLPKDAHYDFADEAADHKQEEELKRKQQRTTYIKRVIAHPSFHNINFKQAEKMMETMDQGDVIIRPSSKGENHLTVTWKVCDNIYQHVDVREEGKENAFSLGSTLWINTEEFEDLDEIVARYVQPMASFARDLLGHKYYQDCNGGDRKKLEELLVKTKKEKPTFIPYFVCSCKDLPGKFLLGYQPRGKPRIEYVTVTPEGFRYRNHIFPTVNGLFRWFKDHYQDPVPGKAQVPPPHIPQASSLRGLFPLLSS